MAAHQSAIRLDSQICFAVYNANRLYNKFYQLALAPFQLTYPQYAVLLALWEEDAVTLRALGQKLHLESNTLTPLLKRLEKNGWVTRERPLVDKRQLLLHLTDFGKKKQAEVMQAVLGCANQMALSEASYHDSLNKIQELNVILSRQINEMENGTSCIAEEHPTRCEQ